MNRTISHFVLLFFISMLFINCIHGQATSQRIIVQFKPTVDAKARKVINTKTFSHSTINQLNQKHQVSKISRTGNPRHNNTFVLHFDKATDTASTIAAYQATGLFEYVEPDYIGTGHGQRQEMTPNDNLFSRQWGHHNDGTFSLSPSKVDADIDSDKAWDITQGSTDIIVAILDSGLKLDHPEFKGRIWKNTDENASSPDADNNGYANDIYGGWDFASGDNYPSDGLGHGTNVAGITLATGNNDTGYAGMDWNAQIMVCRILDNNNRGYYSWWAEAIYYAVDNGANVINMSAGGDSPSYLLRQAAQYALDKNVALVVSSGNQNSVIQYPANYTSTLAIGSTNADDTRSVPFFWDPSSGSNYGANLDFVAPGNYIFGLSHTSNQDYSTYWGGTSQAAPHVAGVISLMLSIDKTLTVNKIKDILKETAEDQVGNYTDVAGWDQYYGHGRVNAYEAVRAVQATTSTHEHLQNEALVSPNPIAKGSPITITHLPVTNYKASIYNISGKKMYEQEIKVQQPTIQIEVPTLQSGSYILNLISKHSQITRQIIID